MPTGHYQRTIEHRKKMSQTAKKFGFGKWMKGRKPSAEVTEKNSLAHLGKKKLAETKLKMSLSKKGDKNYSWKGGKYIDLGGYIRIYSPKHPFNNGKYVLEHRLVVEKEIGKYLPLESAVHHINHNRKDNHKGNLIAFVNNRSHRNFEHGNAVDLCDIIFDGRKYA